MGRRHARLRLVLLIGAFVLALLPNLGTPAVATPRFSGQIVGKDVTQAWPARDGRGLSTPIAEPVGLDAGSTGGGTLLYTSDTIDAGQLFGRLAVHWIPARGQQDALFIEARASADGRSWGPWTGVTEDEDMFDPDTGERFGAPFEVSASRYAQYRVWLTGGDPGALARVSLTFIDVSDLNAGPIARLFNDLRGAFADVFDPPAASAASSVRILTRQDWGADESKMQWPPRYEPASKFIVHQTATSDGGNDTAAAIRSIYYYHAVTRGWGDIGYNYLVDKNGNIWTGRQGGDNVVGGHAYGWNNGTIGVAGIGDYSRVAPTAAMMQAYAKIIAIKGTQLGIQPLGNDTFTHQEQASDGTWVKVTGNPPNVIGHSDANYIVGQNGGQTADPGVIYPLLPSLRLAAQTYVNEGYVDMPYLEPQLPRAAFPGAVLQVPVAVINKGRTAIPAGTLVSYQMLRNGTVALAQGAVQPLPAPVNPGQSATVTVPFAVPALGVYVVRWDLQTNGQWWNALKSAPVRELSFNSADWSVEWVRDDAKSVWTAGETKQVTVTLANDGGRPWPNAATDPTGAVRLGYKWVSSSTGNTFPGAQRFDLPATVQPGERVTLTVPIGAPVYPTNYTLYLDLYKGAEFAFSERGIAPDELAIGVNVDFNATYQFGAVPRFAAGAAATVPVTIKNTGLGTLPVTSSYPVDLAYHWYTPTGTPVVWDGLRTKLPADLLSGQSVQLQATVQAPPQGGQYELRFDLVQEGVAWFSQKGLATGTIATTVAAPVIPSYGASYQAAPPPTAAAGATVTVPVTVANASNFAWSSSGEKPVNLAYHFYDSAGRLVLWDGARTKLPADVGPGASATVQAAVLFPTTVGTYTLRFDLVQEGVAWFSQKGVATGNVTATVGAPPPTSGYDATYGISQVPTAMSAGLRATVPVTLRNTSTFAWTPASTNPVNLAYHWYDAAGKVVVWDGLRTPLSIAAGATALVNAQVQAPASPGTYVLRFDLVQEGITWFSSKGVTNGATTVAVNVAPYGASFTSAPVSVGAAPGGVVLVPLTIKNTGSLVWDVSKGFDVAYHIVSASGAVKVWDGLRTALPASVPPGQSATLNAVVRAPETAGPYVIQFEVVQEGVTWFSGKSVPTGDVALDVR